MQMTESRTERILKRAACLKRAAARKRFHLLSACSFALCLLAIAGFGMQMPGWMAGLSSSDNAGTVRHASGAASLIASHALLGYLVMGLLSFSLGICLTLLLFRIRRRSERQRREGKKHDA